MVFKKCPRCELNYILDGGALCTVCRREVRGEQVGDDTIELCSECGENPVIPGSEFCAQCLKEMSRRRVPESVDSDEQITPEEAALSIDNDVSTMDEIVIDDVGADDAPFDDEFMDADDDPADSKSRSRRKKTQADDFAENGFTVDGEGETGGKDEGLFNR